MELFQNLFSSLLLFVYHCFDRIVINGYLSALTRPENAVYFFREVLGVPAITKEVLKQRTEHYNRWVDAYARKRKIPVEWAEKGVRKEDYVQRWLRSIEHHNQHGVYFIFKSMEQGQTFRSVPPKFPTSDPHYRILHKNRTRFTHYYFYIRDEVLGPMVVRVASFFPFHTATTPAFSRPPSSTTRFSPPGLPHHLLHQRSFVYRKRAAPQGCPVPQEGQRLPGGVRSPGSTSGCRSLEPRNHP